LALAKLQKKKKQSIKQKKSEILKTHPVFAFTDLEHPEFLATRTQHHQSLHLVMDLLGVVVDGFLLPVGPQGRDKLLPIYQAAVVLIEHVGYVLHL
jgi:hypothetical protein